MKENRKKAKPFNCFLNELRTKRNIPMKQLCEGLCSPRTAWYLENGERKPDKLLQDRLLERLGIGAEDYEHFLYYNEYSRWEARQRIIHNITYENLERAELLLREYQTVYDMDNKLESQFYLSMLAQIRRCQGESHDTLYALFQEAARLTVPASEEKPLAELCLSVKELNLLLEAEQYRKEGERPRKYQEIMEYLCLDRFDRASIAMLYPKAVYFLCRSLLKPDCQIAARLLPYCNHALALLRSHARMYYLWEILNMRETLLAEMIRQLNMRQEPEKASTLTPMRRENAEWKQALEKTYEEFHVPKETFEYCYLYVVNGTFCINDVIRIRREMLGMSQKELSQGICSLITLQRLEGRKTTAHKDITEELFERLGLSGEFTRTNLVTSSHEAKLLMKKLRHHINDGNWNCADTLQQNIKELIPLEIPNNLQAVMRQNTLCRWKNGEINKAEYRIQMQKTLELTLPYQSFLKEGIKYLTTEEQICIQNMMEAIDEKDWEYADCVLRFEELYQPYQSNELLESVFNTYELVMTNIGSWQGNQENFDCSIQHNADLITGCLRLRRLSTIHNNLYGIWWNHTAQKNKGIPNIEPLGGKDVLQRCIIFSRLIKQEKREQFYRKKMDEQST